MADNTVMNPGVGGDTYASDDISGVKYTRVKIVTGADGVNSGDVSPTVPLPNRPVSSIVTVQTAVTLAGSSVYAINDAMSNSTSAPTSGGFTLSNCARVSGGSGIIMDATLASSAVPALLLQCEALIYSQAVSAINDNAVFVQSDAENATLVARIPFTLESMGANNSWGDAYVNRAFTCVGSADLRFLYRCKNAYIPATDVLTLTLKILQDG